MNYLIYALAVIGGFVVFTGLAWGGMAWLEGYRYRKAIGRRVDQIDEEMRKRGEVL